MVCLNIVWPVLRLCDYDPVRPKGRYNLPQFEKTVKGYSTLSTCSLNNLSLSTTNEIHSFISSSARPTEDSFERGQSKDLRRVYTCTVHKHVHVLYMCFQFICMVIFL